MGMNSKVYTIYAGVNGAGKSTLYKAAKTKPEGERINSDEILVANGGNWKNERDQARAMREVVERIRSCVKDGRSFNQETTLTGHSILGVIKKAKEQGFEIRLSYIGVESADLAVERVKERVNKGGHGIDESVIRKRYETSFSMLKKVMPLCDSVEIIDNTKTFRGIAEYTNGSWKLYNKECGWFNKIINELNKEKEA